MKHIDRDLMLLLHGELPADRARQLTARLRREPELARRYERLGRVWRGLELPPPSPVPPGFTGRVMARVAAQRRAELSWRAAPGWLRGAAAAALAAGMTLGVGLGLWQAPMDSPEAAGGAGIELAALGGLGEDLAGDPGDLSLAESYLEVMTGGDVLSEEVPR